MNSPQVATRRAATIPIAAASPSLLVSVRSVAEARAIASLPVDVVDLKEPRRGPLGACDPVEWHRTRQVTIGGSWSAALGEADQAVALAEHVPAHFAFAKAGPAGVSTPDQLASLWRQLRRLLPPPVAIVAVAYADWSAAGSLPPEQVLEQAADCSLRTLLVDTYGKDGRSTIDHLGLERLQSLVAQARTHRCDVVLAGGVTFESLPTIAPLGVRRVGVRGGVCRGDRQSQIDAAEVVRWTNWLHRC